MAIQGLIGTGDFVTDERPKNWLQGVLMRYPNGHAPLTALTSAMKKKVTDDPEKTELGEVQEHIIEPGQLFYTVPMVAHAMEFLEDSVFYAFTPRSGDQDDYENDIIRLKVV